MNNFFTPAANDQSVYYLGYIFGTVGNVLNGIDVSTGQVAATGVIILNVVGVMFKVLNTIALTVGVFIVIYTTVMGVIATAHEGEALGKKWSSLWVPLRMVIGVAALFPVKTGYSFLQILIMWVVLQGVYAADKLWTVVLTYVQASGGSPYSTISIPTIGLESQFKNLFQNLVCQAHAASRNTKKDSNNVYYYYCGDPTHQGTGGWCANTSNMLTIPQGASTDGNTKLTYSMGPGGSCGTLQYDALTADRTSLAGVATLAQQQGLQAVVTQLGGVAQALADLDSAYFSFYSSGLPPSQFTNGNFIQTYCNSLSPPLTSPTQCCYKINISTITGGCLTNDASIMPPATDSAYAFPTTNVSQSAMSKVYWPFGLKSLLQTDANNPASTDFIRNSINFYVSTITVAITNYFSSSQAAQSLSDWYKDASDLGWILAGGYYYKLTNSGDNSTNKTLPADPVVSSVDPNGPGSQNGAVQNSRTNWNSALYLLSLTQAARGSGSMDSAAAISPSLGKVSDFSGSVGTSVVKTFMDNLTGASSSGGASTNQLKTNPLVRIVNFGQTLMTIGDATWVAFMVLFSVLLYALGWVPFALGTATMTPLGTGTAGLVSLMLPLIMAFLAFCYSFGGMLAVYVPLIPYIVFTMGAIGWMIGVIEAMVAAPFIALGILAPGEQANVWGRSEQALMPLLNIFLRPTLMIFGMMVSMLLSTIAIVLLNSGFLSVMQSISTTNKGAQSVVLPFIFLAAYASLVVSILNKAFSIIHVLPDGVLKWIGGSHAPGGGETGQEALAGAKEKSGAMGAAAGAGLGAALSKPTEKMKELRGKAESRAENKAERARGREEDKEEKLKNQGGAGDIEGE